MPPSPSSARGSAAGGRFEPQVQLGKYPILREIGRGATSHVYLARDPFADPRQLAVTIAALPRATLHRVEGADHGHKVRGRTSAEVTAELAGVAAAWIASLPR